SSKGLFQGFSEGTKVLRRGCSMRPILTFELEVDMIAKLFLNIAVATTLAAGAGLAFAQTSDSKATRAPAASQAFIKEAIQGNWPRSKWASSLRPRV
ncbi:MAG: hypothetical protein AB7I59_31765, partial [Geminicoccaceae bacterium]